jgi:hypothetical protein
MNNQDELSNQDALKRLDQLEAEARKLRAIIDPPPLPTRWKAENGENFWHVTSTGETKLIRYSPDNVAHGNCFKDYVHAGAAAEAVRWTLMIVACAFEVDPDAGEREPGERQWTVAKHDDWWYEIESVLVENDPIYVHTKEQAAQLAAMLDAEGL